MSSTIGSDVVSGAASSSGAVLTEFDAEYACTDHAVVRQVVQTAVRNYFSSSCIYPAHMTLCIDFTENASLRSGSALQYQAPSIQINVERKSDSDSLNSITAKGNSSVISSSSTGISPIRQRKVGRRTQGRIFNAAKRLPVYTITEEENMKPTKAVTKIFKSKKMELCTLKCPEKKIAEKKVFKYESAGYKKLLSEDMMQQWHKKYEEDKQELYSDRQLTPKDLSSSSMTARSDLSLVQREKGTITEDVQTSGWPQTSGIVEFEPKNTFGNVSKAIQIRGNFSCI
ncbi:unnamed protein product [Thelazia callipaeda]|uniref:HMG box domain-containing protein n=1 Tax=Thelazia callipaeda TaxID=103827 RepID=A0A0N5D0Z4_THECL|nr:unnamed protein product [Thelazia callipaeda]